MNKVLLNNKRSKAERVQDELKRAHISNFGLHRFTSHYLPNIIHDDEHIEGAVFGRQTETQGLFGLVEGMLVATDERVIFIDHRPGYTTMDEFGYDVVSGISISKAGLQASLTVHTKIGDYKLSFANPGAIEQFVECIEKRRIQGYDAAAHEVVEALEISDKAADFLARHEIGVLSSIDAKGRAIGAAVYYKMRDGMPYFMTKSGARKSSNILHNQHVALTIYDESKLQTVQMQGIVEAESDEQTKMEISDAIIVPRRYDSGSHLPPLMQLAGDKFIVFRIMPTMFSFHDYSEKD